MNERKPADRLINGEKVREVMEKMQKFLDTLNLNAEEMLYIIGELHKNATIIDRIKRTMGVTNLIGPENKSNVKFNGGGGYVG